MQCHLPVDMDCHYTRGPPEAGHYTKTELYPAEAKTSTITERYTLIEVLKTWTEAQQYCREHHTDLVSIKNASENEDLEKKAQGKPFWIGLFNEPWKWSHQGDNYTFHYWVNKQPNNFDNKQKCVAMKNSGEWNDLNCNTQNPFFCCEGGSSGQCFYEGTKKTWQEAQIYCRNQGRDLPTIQEQYRVNKLIGIIPKTSENHFWIGLYHDKENWQWSSGDDIIYSNWDPYLFCASVNSDGEWEDSVCSEKKAFMCYNDMSPLEHWEEVLKIEVNRSQVQGCPVTRTRGLLCLPRLHTNLSRMCLSSPPDRCGSLPSLRLRVAFLSRDRSLCGRLDMYLLFNNCTIQNGAGWTW
ncbi:UNVERIFIED_CONTAM: hypothetical protein FKN15_069706 [Acipenser sinensis]